MGKWFHALLSLCRAADWKDQVAVVRVEFVTKGKEAAIKLIRHETDKVCGFL